MCRIDYSREWEDLEFKMASHFFVGGKTVNARKDEWIASNGLRKDSKCQL